MEDIILLLNIYFFYKKQAIHKKSDRFIRNRKDGLV